MFEIRKGAFAGVRGRRKEDFIHSKEVSLKVRVAVGGTHRTRWREKRERESEMSFYLSNALLTLRITQPGVNIQSPVAELACP